MVIKIKNIIALFSIMFLIMPIVYSIDNLYVNSLNQCLSSKTSNDYSSWFECQSYVN